MHAVYMREAIELAAEGVRQGHGGPFGAVVVRDGRVVGRGWNRVVTLRDPTSHAEMNAIRDACAHLGDFRLSGCELYTSCQPCPMCQAAAVWARLDRVWFAAARADAARLGFDDARVAHRLERPGPSDWLSPCDEGLRGEALAVFRLWRDSPLRVDY
jgi:tRNA(Arg) A34 adenosine deaminase TadA